MAADNYEFTRKIVCKDCYEVNEERLLEYFKFEHLPKKLQDISLPFYNIAYTMNKQLPAGPEKSAGLRKLLEAKDCMMRAAL